MTVLELYNLRKRYYDVNYAFSVISKRRTNEQINKKVANVLQFMKTSFRIYVNLDIKSYFRMWLAKETNNSETPKTRMMTFKDQINISKGKSRPNNQNKLGKV